MSIRAEGALMTDIDLLRRAAQQNATAASNQRDPSRATAMRQHAEHVEREAQRMERSARRRTRPPAPDSEDES